MKIKRRLLAFLLTLTMVLTFMPAMAFADNVSTAGRAEKIEYKGNTEYLPAGVWENESDSFEGFYTAGNEVTVTWEDKSTTKFVSMAYDCKYEGGLAGVNVDYFLEGENPVLVENPDGSAYPENAAELYYTAEGNGKFRIEYYYSYKDSDGEEQNDYIQSDEITGKTVKDFTYSGPKLEYDQDERSGEIYGWESERQEGAVITINFDDGTSRKVVCQKWGTNKDSDGNVYDEYSYFPEGVTPKVIPDSDGNNYADNQEYFDFMWDKATTSEVPVEYKGVTVKFPISKKVYPKPVKLEFVPVAGFSATAPIGEGSFWEDALYVKGNKLVVTWDDGRTVDYPYGKYKDNDGDTYECFGFLEDGWVQSVYLDFNSARIKKGDNVITGKTSIWAEGYYDDFTLSCKVNVKGSGYLAYAKYNTYTYTGKTVNPKVTVYVANDNGKMVKLNKSKYTYKAKKGKKVGEYYFDIKLKNKKDKAKYGNYIRCWYSIVPKAPAGVKVKAGSKQLTVSWKKLSGAAGYSVMVSKDKDFRDVDYLQDISKKKTKVVVKNLQKGKTYYVRVQSIQKGTYTWFDSKNKKHTSKTNFYSKPVVKKVKVK